MSDRRDDFRRDSDNPLQKFVSVWWQVLLSLVAVAVMFIQYGSRITTVEKQQTVMQQLQVEQTATLNAHDKQLALIAQDIGYIKETVTKTDRRLRQGANDK